MEQEAEAEGIDVHQDECMDIPMRKDDSVPVVLFECPVCLRKVDELYPVAPEDILREHTQGWKACASCLQKLRDSGHQVVRYNGWIILRDLVVITGLLSCVLVSLSYVLPAILGASWLGVTHLSSYPPLVAFLMGLTTSFFGIRNRYAVSHGLRWSMQAQGVIIGFAFMLAGLLSIIAVIQLRV